jgi:hypothetical protein
MIDTIIRPSTSEDVTKGKVGQCLQSRFKYGTIYFAGGDSYAGTTPSRIEQLL